MANKFMKSSDVYKTSNETASWSDAEGFYKRVHWLSTESHAASNDDEDINDYLMSLEQLHLEIEGAINNSKDAKELEALRKKTKQWVHSSDNFNKTLATKRENVRPYHSLINRYCHKYGLFLRKNLGNSLDSWDNE